MAKDAIESFVVAVFPRAAWIDLDRLYANLSKPILKVLSNELSAIVGMNKAARFYFESIMRCLLLRLNAKSDAGCINKKWKRSKFGLPVFHQQPMHDLQNIIRVDFVTHLNAERLTGKFIQDGQHLVTSPIAELVVNKIDSPDMIGMHRAQTNN